MHENPFAALVLIENGNFLGGCTSVTISESSVMSLSAKSLPNDTRATLFASSLLKQNLENKTKIK